MIKENKLAKVYQVNQNHEYGTFVLIYKENYLEIICHTSFGTYGHEWPNPGKNPYDFLLNMSYNTFIKKMSGGKHLVLDNDKQEKIMFDLINDLAPLKQWSEEDIGYYKSLVEEVTSGPMTANEFKGQLVHSELFEELYEGESEQIEVEEDIDSQLQGLWNELWTPLMRKLKEEKINKETEVSGKLEHYK